MILMNNKQPTYLNNENGVNSLIDLVEPSLALHAATSEPKQPFDSDHVPVFTTIPGKMKDISTNEPQWKTKKANWDTCKDKSEQKVAIENCASANVDEYFRNVCEQIYICADAAIPKTNPTPPTNITLLYWNETNKSAVSNKNKASKSN